MSSRNPGTFNFSANFETLVAAPLDARGTVLSLTELTNSSLPYPYLGMPVAVTSDTGATTNGLYILKGLPATDINNWYKIAEGGSVVTITGFTINGTIETIWLSNGNSFEVDLNDIQIANEQYLNGLSTHSFQKIDTSTGTTWNAETISGNTYNVANIEYGLSVAPAKMNIVVVDLVTMGDTHHLIRLPNILTINEAGAVYKIIVKEANNSNLDKYTMIFSSGVTSSYRIIAPYIKTKYNGSYFVPMETMESIEIIWDGSDFLVTNITKQAYVALNAENFFDMGSDPLFNTNYLIRDINNLI